MLEVEVGDRCLDDVRPALVQRKRTFELLAALVDLVLIPESAVLIVEQDELAAQEPGRAARVVDSMSASRACASASSGISSTTERPSRIAYADRSTRPPPQPSLKIR